MACAVVFDLWQTLVVYPEDDSAAFRDRWAERLGIDAEVLDERWYADAVYAQRESGPIRAALEALHRDLGVEADLEEILGWRLEFTRRALVPVDGALETLQALRDRGVKTGLISNCTEDVALVWDDTPFAGRFDVAVFSATAGCLKPERRIYELALSKLDVPASDALFVGDGVSDELRGAAEVGMTPVLARLDGVRRSPAAESWSGLSVTAIPQVLELVA